MSQKKYQEPEIDIINVYPEDVISTSGIVEGGGTEFPEISDHFNDSNWRG